MFNLENAIAAWRRPFEVDPVFSPDDIEELEGSLRDRFELLSAKGLSDENAFRQAAKQSGSYISAETEYRKVRWGKRRNEGRLMDEFVGRISMVKNDLTIALRILRKQKGYAFICVFGLAIGLASCLLIANHVYNQLSYDRFHEDANNIYRVNIIFTDNSGTATRMANSPPALLPGVSEEFPEIKRFARLRYAGRTIFEQGQNRFYENSGFYADSSFLDIFSFPLMLGDKDTALDQPNSIVITEEIATKYFGDEDPVGKLLNMNNGIPLRVTGILASIPATSHLQFDFLVSFSTYVVPAGYRSDLTSWSWLGFLTFVQLQDGASGSELRDKLDKVYRDNSTGDWVPFQTEVQPLTDIYFGSAGLVDDLASGLQSANLTTVYVIGIVALMILLIACFNFANLAMAVSTGRRKGVILRRILGADRGRLVRHLLVEPIALSFLGLALAYLLSLVAFPYIKGVLGWNYSIDWTLVQLSIPIAVLIALILGAIAGLYPALVLSDQKAVLALKDDLRTGSAMRKTLIAFQFCISIVLIASTFVVNGQIQYLSEQELGFEGESVVVMKPLSQEMASHYEEFKSRLLSNSDFVNVSRGERSMGEPWPVNSILVDGRDESESKQVMGNHVGYDYVETMGIKLVEGRTFSKEYPRDSTNSIILSASAVEYLGLENPIGTEIQHFTLDGPRTVIGVVEDINYSSLHHERTPMVLIMNFVDVDYLFIRLSPGQLSEKIAALEKVWEATVPGLPMEFRFLDDQVTELYQKEQTLSYLINAFTGLAIVLAILGLYGLISFAVNQRMKEIGVRKVLGASFPSLLVLFSRQYALLLVIASAIAIPVMRYVMGLWLEDFAYRMEISWWIYILPTVLLAFVALATIMHRTVYASLVNPVEVLRSE